MSSTQRLPWAGSVRPRKALAFAAMSAIAVTSVTALTTLDPHEPGHYPTCPFLALSGYYCPGCGSLRATYDLLHGDLAGSLARNPLTIVALVYFVMAWAAAGWSATGRRAPSSIDIPPWVLYGVFVLLLAFWGLRNVPGWTWLSPA